jgi:hypothetical protein
MRINGKSKLDVVPDEIIYPCLVQGRTIREYFDKRVANAIRILQ